MNLSVAIITKGEPSLKACLESVYGVADDIVLMCDPADQPAIREFVTDKVRMVPRRWEDDFSATRNASFAACKSNLVLWIDSDDTLVGGPELVRFLGDIDSHAGLCISGVYEYHHSEDGKCLVSQIRERIVDRRCGEWVCPIHEIWMAQRPVTNLVLPESVYIKHGPCSDLDLTTKKLRNLGIMQTALSNGKPDRRLISHYISALVDLGRFEHAIEIGTDFISKEPPGWPRHRLQMQMARSWAGLGQWQTAADCAVLALGQMPSSLDARTALVETMYFLKRWDCCLYWFHSAYETTESRTQDVTAFNPAAKDHPPYEIAARAAFESFYLEQAKDYARLSGDEDLTKEIAEAIEDRDANNVFERLVEDSDLESHELMWLAEKLPKRLHDLPAFGRALSVDLDKVEGKTVAIFCGSHGSGKKMGWDPCDVEGGIGGSEEAIVRLGKEMALKGAHVEVYGPFAKEVEQDGVFYKHFTHWAPERSFDLFVAWRFGEFISVGKASKHRVMWIHDIPAADWLHGCDDPDELWTLCQHHADLCQSLWPHLPVWITSNGLPDLSDVPIDKVPGRVIYASSPDRGVHHVLDWWPEIKAQVPHATLDIYYGFTAAWYDTEAMRIEMREYRESVEQQAAELDGVTWHGMVGQDELHKAFGQAQAWLYPCEWDETSCITAMKAQALGAMPVTTRRAALNETVIWGHRFGEGPEDRDPTKYKDELISATVRAIEKPDTGHPTWETWAWANVADKWLKHNEEHINARTVRGPEPDAPVRSGGRGPDAGDGRPEGGAAGGGPAPRAGSGPVLAPGLSTPDARGGSDGRGHQNEPGASGLAGEGSGLDGRDSAPAPAQPQPQADPSGSTAEDVGSSRGGS